MILLAVIGIAALECAVIASGRWTTQYQFIPSRIWVVIPLCWLAVAALVAVPAYALSRRWGSAITPVLLGCVLLGVRVPGASTRMVVIFGLTALAGIALMRPIARWWLARPRRSAAWAAVLVLIACAIGAAATSGPLRQPRATAAASQGPNVIVIFLDTVRYDALFTAAGDVRPELPALRRLASESVVFDAAYAPSPWTLPSHLSAVTGLPYEKLGVDFSHQEYRDSTLTLAERFRRGGYRTAAVLANSFLNPGTGFARGFDSFEYATGALDVCRTAPGRALDRSWPFFAAAVCNWSASEVTKRALRQMDDASGPYLLVLNYMDAHGPNYVERGCGGGAPSYERALRCIDRRLAQIVDRAAKSPRGTVIAITSDHGEHFGEHGLFSHGNSLYRELLHIPLLIRTTVRTHTRIPTPVTLAELPSLLTDPLAAPTRQVSASGILDDPRAVTVIRDRWQLIVHGDGREEWIALTESAVPPPLDLMRHDAQGILRAMKPLPESHFRSLGYEQ